MKTFQEALTEEVTRIVEKNGLGIYGEYKFSNYGRWLIGHLGETKFTIDFDFQPPPGRIMLRFNGKPHGPSSPDNFFFSADDDEEIQRFLARVKELCEA